MAKTYRRKKLANGRVPKHKTLIDHYKANSFVKFYDDFRFFTDKQKVPSFKEFTNNQNKLDRKNIKEELSRVKSREDAENLVLKKTKKTPLSKYIWWYFD